MQTGTTNLGKIPPQAIDIEEAIIGAMLIDSRGVSDAFEVLKVNPFYKPSNRYIFDAIKTLYVDSLAIDLLTVSQQLKKENKLSAVGGDYYLIGLSQKVSSSAHIQRHCQIIMQYYVKREMITSNTEVIADCFNEEKDVFELIDSSYSRLNQVAESVSIDKESLFSDVISSVVEKGVKIKNGQIEAGIPTPISDLNNYYKGWKDSNLVILAGRPGMGKTAFALCSVLNAVKHNKAAVFFSMEMSKEQLVSRLLSIETGISLDRFITIGIDDSELRIIQDSRSYIDKMPLYIDDNTTTITELVIKSKRLHANKDVKIIFIDYLQLLSASHLRNREQEISYISRTLKKLSKELDIPVIALSQLSRAVEQRGGSKRPMLSDLRESGAIEQDADDVMFLYRPEYYGIDEWDDNERTSTKGQAEIIVAKHRSGSLGACKMQFIGRLTKFENLKDDFFEESSLPHGTLDSAF